MEPSIYQELDRAIERLIMDSALSNFSEVTIHCCKQSARKMIDSGEFTVEQMIQRIKDLNEAASLQEPPMDKG